jgi:hypothetical protein
MTAMNKIVTIIILISLSFIISSCSDTVNNVIVPPEHDYSPMWPQIGYNAQNTSNPYAPKVKCQPVQLGTVDWYYEFPQAYYSDGAEFTVDSKSNIYFISQQDPIHKVYKFRTDGTVIWKIDSVHSYNYAFITLSSDESKIYFHSRELLYCYDSSGKYNWNTQQGWIYPKPSIGKDGTI